MCSSCCQKSLPSRFAMPTLSALQYFSMCSVTAFISCTQALTYHWKFYSVHYSVQPINQTSLVAITDEETMDNRCFKKELNRYNVLKMSFGYQEEKGTSFRRLQSSARLYTRGLACQRQLNTKKVAKITSVVNTVVVQSA